jgi:hypothetical protein
MLDMLHLLTVVSLFAGAWLISRGAAYVARKVPGLARPAHRGRRGDRGPSGSRT